LTTSSGDPPAAMAMIDFFEGLTSDEAHAKTPKQALNGLLSTREIEVLRLVAAGKSNQQIADELVVSLSTVLHHVTNILTKTGCSNRTEAAAFAHRHGLS
jgi:NarL family two-component system response regulator LiaR